MVWAWFRPPQAPNAVVFQLPPELFAAVTNSPRLTMRMLLAAVGMEAVVGWTLYGQQFALDAETMRWLEADLPQPTGNDQHLTFWAPLAAVAMPNPVAATATPTAGSDLAAGENPGPHFEMIEFFWTNILYLESDVRRARTQLEHSISKLNGLNRDLSPEEANSADTVDRQQWQDARRWLREAISSLTRSTKEIDVGLLSAAGQRNRFLDIYEKFVKSRTPFPGIKQAVVDFEMHQKAARNVLQAAQAAINKGTSDGERRATLILQRIAQKVREKSNQARGKKA